MLTVAEAHKHIARCVQLLPATRLRLSALLGLKLAEPVTSTVDSPPFDKALVDGYAIDVDDRSPTLREIELVTAGGVPSLSLAPGATIRVMTGAPLPAGAHAVVKWEDCDLIEDGVIRNPAAGVSRGACVLHRGASFRAGQTVLESGKRLGPLDIALLAEIGQAEVAAIPRPRVGVLPTGDELVDAAAHTLAPGQIRNSNGPMLLAALAAAGMPAVDLGVARDNERDLRDRIARGLECDVLLISGGVSAGIKDLVPGTLKELGVEEVFHQIRLKPGKPLWFGVRDAARTQNRALVFGLPGNPVSTMVTFKLFVLPALAALAGEPFTPAEPQTAVLAAPFKHRGNRPTYHPSARLKEDGGVCNSPPCIEPLAWRGSADLATLTRADSLAIFPPGDYELPAGAPISFLPL